MRLTRQGLRDLNRWSPDNDRPVPVNYVSRHLRPETAKTKAEEPLYTDEQRQDDEADRIFSDLIYAGAIETEVRAAFPEARFEDASDMIHDERTDVKLHTSKRKWFRFLIETGMASISLCFQIEMRTSPGLIFSLMDEVRPGWRNRSASR